MIDALTGLPSRRELDGQLRKDLLRCADDGTSLSLVFFDIDHFKAVNDTHGHAVGDIVIQHVAQQIRESTNGNGMCARYGGEEFVVVLPKEEREQAFLMAEKIRAALEKAPISVDSGVLHVTLSAGVAAFPTDGSDSREVMRKADQALYRAKVTGRNKVCIAQEEKMATKTTHYTKTQLERLSRLAEEERVGEAVLLREALDDLLTKYKVSDIET